MQKTEPAAATEWQIGANVPWSVSWTGEQSFELVQSNDFPGYFEVTQAEHQGSGSPRFATQHITRQRMGVARHFCHVCGKITLKRDRYIFPLHSGGFVTLSDDQLRYAGNVPPVHLACAKRAQRLCPHLSSVFAQPIAYPSEESKLMPRLDVIEGLEALAKQLPPNLPVVYSCYRLYGPRFSRFVKKLRSDVPQPHKV